MCEMRNFLPKILRAWRRSHRSFLLTAAIPEVTAACFGVPGPVRGGRLKLTNLPWVLDCRELSHELKIEHLFLINDLEANGYGIPELSADQIFQLSAGDAGSGRQSRIGVGGHGTGRGDPGVERQDACSDGFRRRALRLFCTQRP